MKRSEVTIFVVEDDASIRFGLEEVLRSEGFQVVSCNDGGKVIQASAKPCLISLSSMSCCPIVAAMRLRLSFARVVAEFLF